jgi:hypothetical protein
MCPHELEHYILTALAILTVVVTLFAMRLG